MKLATFTTSVRNICEVSTGLSESVGNNDVKQVIKKCLPVVFNFDFPIFDEEYRTVLETKILRHYYMYEIGLETVGLWKMQLETKLNEIMPYYNQLYKSELLEFNPLYNTDYTREGNRDNKGTKDSSNTGNSSRDGTTTNEQDTKTDNVNAYSDTPQGSLTDVKNLKYLTNATIVDDTMNTSGSTTITDKTNTTNTGKESSTSTDEYIEKIKGNTGNNNSEMLMKFRETFLNIDMMIIEDLADLFYLYWRAC